MIDRFFEDIEWPGRRVRAVGDDRPEPDALPAQRIITAARRAEIDKDLEAARAAVVALEDQALKIISEELSVALDERPQTQEAVKYLAGTHPAFGDGRPEVPEEDQLDDSGLTAPILGRAHGVMEHADRNGLGFDANDLTESGLNGRVRPYTSIDSPAVAAGERGGTRGAERALESVVETRLQAEKQSIWKQAFHAVVPFIFQLIARIFDRMGDKAASLLSVRIAGARFGVGKWIAKPFYWIRDIFTRLADRFMERALGSTPEAPEPPNAGRPGVRLGDDDEAGGLNEDVTQEDIDYATYGSPPGFGSAQTGTVYLMSAQQVLRAAESEARSSPRLAQALGAYASARQLRQSLNQTASKADTWSSQPAGDSADRPDDPGGPSAVASPQGAPEC